MLHERRFRKRLQDGEQSRGLVVLLHALVVSTLRHMNHNDIGISIEEINDQVSVSREVVMREALDSLSVEHAQSLIMICWDLMGSAEWLKAWSILGSLTRTVDYLQMTMEPEGTNRRPLLAPLNLLDEPKSHAEAEERKRVFWNTFLLDRLVSVSCGWSTGFSSDNVSRKLPCNGGIWRRSEKAETPFFGIWEKSQAKM